MKRVHIRTKIPVSRIKTPPSIIERDGFERITQNLYQYTSFYIQYDATWITDKSVLDTYTQTFHDGVAP